ncbi:MAG: hypothetical protein LLG14_24915 [Nocardiaceae bacterium]|nr:hypothetical protein [Nocardiaceae bacterium]
MVAAVIAVFAFSNSHRTDESVAGGTTPATDRPAAGGISTPPLLRYVSLNHQQSTKELLDDLAAKAARQLPPKGSGSFEYVKTRGWYLSTATMPDGTTRDLGTEPSERQLWAGADGSGRFEETRAGKPADSNGSYPASTIPRLELAPDATVDEIVHTLLHQHPDWTTEQWFVGAGDIWRINAVRPELQSALLKIISMREGVHVLGTTTDREGRTSLAISAFSPGNSNERVIILNPVTGAVQGTETVAHTPEGLPGIDIPVPATISYTTWIETGYTNTTTERP